jgi:hypothetical protein
MLAGLILAGPLLVTGQLTESLVGPGFIGIMGAAAFAYNAVRLPRWAHEREEQMEYMAQRVQTLIKTDTGEP